MIFVTVGNMDPFDRLIRAIDQWLAVTAVEEDVFAQIGRGIYQPKNCGYVSFLTPTKYRHAFQQARLIVSHAGMGTIITALELQKPIVVMPKRASLGEQRNEHQLATVRNFRRTARIQVAETEEELAVILNHVSPVIAAESDATAGNDVASWPTDPVLISFVREFVQSPRSSDFVAKEAPEFLSSSRMKGTS